MQGLVGWSGQQRQCTEVNTHLTAEAIWPGSIVLLALRASPDSGKAVTAAGLPSTQLSLHLSEQPNSTTGEQAEMEAHGYG